MQAFIFAIFDEEKKRGNIEPRLARTAENKVAKPHEYHNTGNRPLTVLYCAKKEFSASEQGINGAKYYQ